MITPQSADRKSAGARYFRVAVWAGVWACFGLLALPVFSGEPPAEVSLRVVENPEGGVVVEWTRAPGPAAGRM